MTPRRARICLISPGHLSTNPRLVKEADALCAAGYQVDVVSASYLPWAVESDAEFADRPWRSLPAQTFGPFAARPRRIRQLVGRQAARGLFALGLRGARTTAAALHQAAPDLIAAARRVQADLYIAHYPAALAAAALAARRHGGGYAFDAEDFHPGCFDEAARPSLEARLIARLERRLLGGCAYVSAASPGIAQAYADIYGMAAPRVVLNVFPRANGPVAASRQGSATPGPSVYWASQTIGPHRGLECAVRAISVARSQPHLYLRGHVSAAFAAALRDLAAKHGVPDQVHLLAPAPPAEMERLASQYDLGYSGEPGHTPNNRQALGNKLFSYLVAGLPIVASDVPAHVGLQPRLGEALRLFAREDHHAAAAAMDALLASPQRLAKARRAAFSLGQQSFNWDQEQRVFLDLVAAALAPKAAGAARPPLAGAA